MYTRDVTRREFLSFKYSRVPNDSSPDNDDKSRTLALTGTRSGTSVPNFKQLIKRHSNAASDYTLDIQDFSGSPCTATCLWTWGGQPWREVVETMTGYPPVAKDADGSFPDASFLDHLPIDLLSLESKALSRLYTRIRAERSQMNGLQFLGELRETIHMIRHPAEALTKQVGAFLKSLEKGKRGLTRISPKRRKAEWSKIFSGSLLEANFGWGPLISDIKSLAESAARINSNVIPLTRIRAEERASNSNVRVNNPNLLFRYPFNQAVVSYTTAGDQVTEGSVRLISMLEWKQVVADNALSRVANVLGFTVENVLPTAYELIPLSFLADYFSNLGDVIEGACTDTSNVIGTIKTTRLKSTYNNRILPASPKVWVDAAGNNLVSYSGTAGSLKLVRSTVTRLASYQLGVPSFSLASPGDHVKRLSNMVALLNEFRHPAGGHNLRLSSLR